MSKIKVLPAIILIMVFIAVSAECIYATTVERPEEIKSKRLVVYDQPTYEKLAAQWKAYYDAYPSEYAYANWMYASRYAENKDYWDLLEKGCQKYKANPTLLYLKSLKNHGSSDNAETVKLLEQSVALDPSFSDPWFLLVVNYMINRDEEMLNEALKHLLEIGIIQDEVMDFCYNILQCLDKNAVIITNGDNDTYPIWILQNILGIRRDVTVLNRSLLNADWYPRYMIDNGAPDFIDEKDLMKLRENLMELYKNDKLVPPPGGMFSDTLMYMVVKSARKANRSVYFSCTTQISDQVKPLLENSRTLGLVKLISQSEESYSKQLERVYTAWLEDFRTSGIESWRLEFAPDGDAARQLICNYSTALAKNMTDIQNYAPQLREKLFEWFLKYADKHVPEKYRKGIYHIWCEQKDVKKIKEWCESKGY